MFAATYTYNNVYTKQRMEYNYYETIIVKNNLMLAKCLNILCI